jgi:hypothetical protein
MSVQAIEKRSQEQHPNEALEQLYDRYIDWGEGFVSSEESGKIDGVQGEIYRDVGRTMPTNPLFESGEGQPVLGRILKAVAFCHTDVGYCQGMNFVAAGILLTVLEEEGGLSENIKSKDAMRAVETKAFFLMCGVLQSCSMQELWRKGLPRVQLRVFQFDSLMQRYLPRLHGHLRTIELTLDFFVSQWFLTLYAYSLPIDAILPVWDSFFEHGWAALFQAGLAVMSLIQEELLKLDMEEASMFMRKTKDAASMAQLLGKDGNELIKIANTFKVTNEELTQLHSQYFVTVIRSYLSGGDQWRDIAPGPMQVKLRQDEHPHTQQLAKIRSELDSMFGVANDDVAVMRRKINEVNVTLNKAVTAYDKTAPAYFEAKMLLEELQETKELWQQQLHQHATNHLLQEGASTAVPATPATPPPPPPPSPPVSKAAIVPAGSPAADVASSLGGKQSDSRGGGRVSAGGAKGLIESDIDVYMRKIETANKRIKIVRPKFERAYAKHAPSELALEEATEMKRSFCSQLIHILTFNENHKTQVVQEFIHSANLEQSFGEDAPREDLPV